MSKKTKIIQIRLTEKEKEKIKQMAQKQDRGNISAFIIRKLLYSN